MVSYRGCGTTHEHNALYITKFLPHQPVVHNPEMDGACRLYDFVVALALGMSFVPPHFIVQEKPQKKMGIIAAYLDSLKSPARAWMKLRLF